MLWQSWTQKRSSAEISKCYVAELKSIGFKIICRDRIVKISVSSPTKFPVSWVWIIRRFETARPEIWLSKYSITSTSLNLATTGLSPYRNKTVILRSMWMEKIFVPTTTLLFRLHKENKLVFVTCIITETLNRDDVTFSPQSTECYDRQKGWRHK